MVENSNTPTHVEPSGPLVGIRIVDFCSFIAGSFGAMLLGDMGADVLKVEATIGDASRSWGPFLQGESRGFQGWNRNKRSLAVDLKEPAGVEIAHHLVRRADVVMENMRPGGHPRHTVTPPAAAGQDRRTTNRVAVARAAASRAASQPLRVATETALSREARASPRVPSCVFR